MQETERRTSMWKMKLWNMEWEHRPVNILWHFCERGRGSTKVKESSVSGKREQEGKEIDREIKTDRAGLQMTTSERRTQMLKDKTALPDDRVWFYG